MRCVYFFPAQPTSTPATVAAFQKMKRVPNRPDLLDGHPCTCSFPQCEHLPPFIPHSFIADGVLKLEY